MYLSKTTTLARAPGFTGAIVLLIVLACSGCDAVLTSAQLPPIREDRILGEWKDRGTSGRTPDPEPVSIQFKDGEYWLGSAGQFAKGEATRFTLARAGNVLLAQSPSKDCDEFGTQKGQPCWSLYRLELFEDRMNWYDFDAERLGKDSFSGALKVPHFVHRQRKKDGGFNNTVLLSADSSELGSFLETYVKRPSVLHLTGRLQRIR
jgi:hypothetical protein